MRIIVSDCHTFHIRNNIVEFFIRYDIGTRFDLILLSIIYNLTDFLWLFIYFYCRSSFERQKKSSFFGKGVRNSHDYLRPQIIFLTRKRNMCLGIRDPNTIYMIKNESSTRKLLYNKPCICGSLNHRNTKDPDCLLNEQYMDV